MSKLTTTSELEVEHAVSSSEETRDKVPPLAPIHLETRSAEQLVELWHETEEALSCRGFIRPIAGIKSDAKAQGTDSRIYCFVDACIGAYMKENRNLAGLDLRAIIRHSLGDRDRPLHLTSDPTKAQAHSEMLRWLWMDTGKFIDATVGRFLAYLDAEKGKKGTL